MIKNCHVITIITFSPLILAFIQLIEIIAVAMLVMNYAKQYPNLAHLSNTFTILKYNLTAVCFGLPIVLFCANILLNLVKKRMRKLE
jgi:hypothetical protein